MVSLMIYAGFMKCNHHCRNTYFFLKCSYLYIPHKSLNKACYCLNTRLHTVVNNKVGLIPTYTEIIYSMRIMHNLHHMSNSSFKLVMVKI